MPARSVVTTWDKKEKQYIAKTQGGKESMIQGEVERV